MVKVIKNSELQGFLNNLSDEYKIAAPIKKEKGKKIRIEYEYIEDFNEISFERQPDVSPKAFFLPQNEVMGLDNSPKANPDDGKKTILFGVRSCDIEATKVFDDVFLDEAYVDPYYKKRRDNTIIFGYSCSERQPSCFCDELGINPIENSRVPIYIYEVEDKYWFKVFDQKYEYLLEGLPDGDEQELEKIIEERKALFNSSNLNLNIDVPIPEKAAFSATVWNDIAEKCLGCGACTFYCPTCYCFGFFWEGEGEESIKGRTWDSCMFSSYTKHASGHNPRVNQGQRWRQRLMHKYSYHPENYGGLACVGCGRCIKECPVKLDIREAIKNTENHLEVEGGAEKDG